MAMLRLEEELHALGRLRVREHLWIGRPVVDGARNLAREHVRILIVKDLRLIPIDVRAGA